MTVMKLEAFKYYYVPARDAGIVAGPTPELLKLQQDLIAAATRLTVESGPIGVFTAPHDDPATDALLIGHTILTRRILPLQICKTTFQL